MGTAPPRCSALTGAPALRNRAGRQPAPRRQRLGVRHPAARAASRPAANASPAPGAVDDRASTGSAAARSTSSPSVHRRAARPERHDDLPEALRRAPAPPARGRCRRSARAPLRRSGGGGPRPRPSRGTRRTGAPTTTDRPTPSSRPRRPSHRGARAARPGAQQRVAGRMEGPSSPSSSGTRSPGSNASFAPASGAIVRSPSGPTSTRARARGKLGVDHQAAHTTPAATAPMRAPATALVVADHADQHRLAPAAASHAAAFAAEPPPLKRISPARRSPRRAARTAGPTTSTITSPRTTIRLTSPARPRSRPPAERSAPRAARSPPGSRRPSPRQVVEQEGRYVLAADAAASAAAIAPRRAPGRAARVNCSSRGADWRPRPRCPGAKFIARPDDRDHLRDRVHPPRHRVPRVREVERRETVGAVPRAPVTFSVSSRSRVAPRRGST